MVLMAEAMARLTANRMQDRSLRKRCTPSVGIALEDVDAIEDVELA